jgi:hypothetical protein
LTLTFSAAVSLGASLDKAKTLRQNGLLNDSKKELVELAFAADSADDTKAQAFLLLGDIAMDEKAYETAKENWTKAATSFPSTPAAAMAKEKLKLLAQLSPAPQEGSKPAAKAYPAGTVLVTAPAKYGWGALQISGVLGRGAVPFEGSLIEAVKIAGEQKGVAAIVELTLDTDSVYESGRVVCYRTNGTKVWEEKTMFNMGGGEERIARRFVDKLSAKVKGRTCP